MRASLCRVVVAALALTIATAGCSLFDNADKPTGENADSYTADASIETPVDLYLPISADFSDIYPPETTEEGLPVVGFSGTDYGRFCGIDGGDAYSAFFWFGDPDLEEPDLGRFSFSVTRLDNVEAAEAEYDRQLKALEDCNRITDESDSSTTLREIEPISGLGDEAVRADAFMVIGWAPAFGDVVLVRSDTTVIVGSHAFSSSAPGGLDLDGTEEFIDLEPSWASRDAAESALRATLDRIGNIAPDALAVREVHPSHVVVENTGDKALVGVRAVSLDTEAKMGTLPVSIIPPGAKAVISRDTDNDFTVVGQQVEADIYQLELVNAEVGGPFTITAKGTIEVASDDNPPQYALVLRDDDGVIVDVQIERFQIDYEAGEDLQPMSLENSGTVRDALGAVTVELMHYR